MAKTDINEQIRSRIDTFLAEISLLVRRSALESVHEALSGDGSGPRRRGPGRPRGTGRGPGRPRGSRTRARAGRRVKRSPEQIAALAARVLAEVRSKQGRRLEELGRAMKTDTAVLKRPIANLLAAKKLKTKGQKRGTKYFVR